MISGNWLFIMTTGQHLLNCMTEVDFNIFIYVCYPHKLLALVSVKTFCQTRCCPYRHELLALSLLNEVFSLLKRGRARRACSKGPGASDLFFPLPNPSPAALVQFYFVCALGNVRERKYKVCEHLRGFNSISKLFSLGTTKVSIWRRSRGSKYLPEC